MAPSLTYRKSRRSNTLRKCAAMRAAKDRKRKEQAREAQCVGTITFDGPMFGGFHIMRCMYSPDYDHKRVMVEIDGTAHRPQTARGVLRMIAKRLTRGDACQNSKH